MSAVATLKRLTWSRQQDQALTAIRQWLRSSNSQTFRLFGYAGTGKTEIAREIGMSMSGVAFAAFTGKAAFVLRQRGCDPVSTIHRLIYRTSFDDDTGKYYHALKAPHELTHSLLIIDEASMVNERLGAGLLSFGIKTLIIADPAQLAPIEGAGYFMRAKPDIMLTEVHRQARDNPILQLADDIRHGKSLPTKLRRNGNGTLWVTDWADPESYDVILVGTNKTRHFWNRRMRKLLGFRRPSEKFKAPQPGETLVCLRNDYSTSYPILNGVRFEVSSVAHNGTAKLPLLKMSITCDDAHTDVRVPYACFTSDDDVSLPHFNDYQIFDFGYALTVHKAQGSEWSRVLLVNESGAFAQDARRWLYTGVTRAMCDLTIIGR